MSKSGWAVTRRSRFAGLILAALLIISACAAATGGDETPVPTSTLIPIPPTATPIPPTITPSPPPRVRPGDLITPTVESPQDRMMTLAIQDAADDLGLTLADVTVATVIEATWRDPVTLDCEAEADLMQPAQYDGYEIILTVRDRVLLYHTDRESTVRRCFNRPVGQVPGEVLIRFDPIASDLLAGARQQLSTTLDIPTRRVMLVEMNLVIWPDNSLGCPQTDQSYTDMRLTGYRLVLSVEDTEYIYHSDTERLVPCDPEDVVLP